MTKSLLKRFDDKLSQKKRAGQLRSLPSPHSHTLHFSSNDPLALARHPLLIQRSHHFASTYGASASAARLLCSLPCHEALEKKLADFVGKEKALLFPSGYQGNLSLLTTLCCKKSLVFADQLCHNSLLRGIISSGATLIRYPHNDLEALEKLLQTSSPQGEIFIVTEALFSMDGDSPNLDKLIALKKEFKAFIYIDEAHSLGVLGPQGKGLAATHPEIDIVVGTFGKAFGSSGAFAACSEPLHRYLINFCEGFTYSTSISPPTVGSIDAALSLLPSMDQERQALSNKASSLRQRLRENWEIGNSSSHIIPIITEEASSLSQALAKQGIYLSAIRPPSVPSGQSRLRLVLSTQHQQKEIDQLVEALETLRTRR